MTRVEGSSVLQTAYQLQQESNLTLRAIEAFPRGFVSRFYLYQHYNVEEEDIII